MSFPILRNELKAPIRIVCSRHMKAQGPYVSTMFNIPIWCHMFPHTRDKIEPGQKVLENAAQKCPERNSCVWWCLPLFVLRKHLPGDHAQCLSNQNCTRKFKSYLHKVVDSSQNHLSPSPPPPPPSSPPSSSSSSPHLSNHLSLNFSFLHQRIHRWSAWSLGPCPPRAPQWSCWAWRTGRLANSHLGHAHSKMMEWRSKLFSLAHTPNQVCKTISPQPTCVYPCGTSHHPEDIGYLAIANFRDHW